MMSHPELRCPICDAKVPESASSFLPFCSDRCRLIDLGRWLNEGYGLEYERPEDPDAEIPDAVGD
ncbi:MAG: DNA gyrase inhibitor YacG [Planctomycetota bacterium]|nr:DNA gyrase inhibitor YacG [Planctomycetota bacterium]